jgi:hypothetical protein
MSATDANPPSNGESSTGKSLVVIDKGAAASGVSGAPAAFGDQLRRWAMPAAFMALAGSAGWYAGAQSSLAVSANHRAAIESSVVSDIKAQAATLALLDARMKSLEEAPKADPALKPSIDILAKRIDEIARTQTVALTQNAARLDRADRDAGARFERLGERVERIEKQVSSSAPVSSTHKSASAPAGGVTALPRITPGDADKADDVEAKAIRNYVLRDVFRGGALVESRQGLIEVFPGAVLPGAGRVRSVERRDGRWVVITTAGVIEARR